MMCFEFDAVHEHEEREWEADAWGLGFEDVEVESCGRESDRGREKEAYSRCVSEIR